MLNKIYINYVRDYTAYCLKKVSARILTKYHLYTLQLELAPLVNPSASKVGRAAPAQWYVRWNHYRNEFVKQNLLNSI